MKTFKQIQCRKCLSPFFPKSSSEKICQKCKTYKCKQCNKDFRVSKLREESTIKYCSKECLYKGRNPQIKHTCQKCHKTFISKSANSTWCEECRTNICQVCNKSYQLKPRLTKLSKYCSRKCRFMADMNYIWKEEDFVYIKQNYPIQKSLKEIAQKFNTSISAVARLKHKLNLADCPIEVRQRRVGDVQMIWTTDKIQKTILMLYHLGKKINSASIQKNYGSLFVAACKRFGIWEKTINSIGFRYSEVNLYSDRINWTTESIINKIIELKDANISLKASHIRDSNTALFLAVKRDKNLLSWEKAITTAGLNYKEICGTSWGQKYIGKDGNTYASIVEGQVADNLYDLLEENTINDYFTQVKISDERRWTCDFVVSYKNDSLWIEVDGLEDSRKEGSYKSENEKIKYYINNNFNFHIITKPNELYEIIKKRTPN